jgi:hypothetical protein
VTKNNLKTLAMMMIDPAWMTKSSVAIPTDGAN